MRSSAHKATRHTRRAALLHSITARKNRGILTPLAYHAWICEKAARLGWHAAWYVSRAVYS